MPIGLILGLFTFASLLSVFAFNHKTKRLFNSYWFYSISSVIALIYFLSFRWVDDLKALINVQGQSDILWSKVLLLDMCPFLAVFLPIVLLVDKKRTFAPCLAYFAIVGAGITIFGEIAWIKLEDTNLSWWQYTFFNKLYFIMHFYIFIMAFIVILNSPTFNWNRVLAAHGYAIGYFSYISIMAFSLDVKQNVTGIVPFDWSSLGQYRVIGQFLNLPWPWAPIIGFTFVWIWILLMMALRNIMVLDQRYLDLKQIEIPRCRNWFLKFYDWIS